MPADGRWDLIRRWKDLNLRFLLMKRHVGR